MFTYPRLEPSKLGRVPRQRGAILEFGEYFKPEELNPSSWC
jgi:hypothetical protein